MLKHAYRAGYEGRPGYKIVLDYDADLVEALKRRIPHTERTWNPEYQYWWVSDAYVPTLVELVPALEQFLIQPTFPGMEL